MNITKPDLYLYDSYQRQKRRFEPLRPPHVGLYVCGPTVYNEVHLGNCRTFVSFDLVFRYLRYLDYRVRYVRNITDVGHLEGDADCGAESKIEQRARLEQLEPMEVVQKYTYGFHAVMKALNTLPPSIEPTATGHIPEQIEWVKQTLARGFAYERNGSVYFDTTKLLSSDDSYGKLSGKKQEDLLSETRDNLKNQDEKNGPADFALWVKAAPTHLMRWNSPWGQGFPGWHLECSVMSTKYLGETFDIHGGGMDLQFPHHENEIAQSIGACGCQPVKYWLHSNMLLLNGRKMSKSEGNFVLPRDLFEHNEQARLVGLSKAYSPAVLRFLFMQTHYRSTLNLTDAGLEGAEKALLRLQQTAAVLAALDLNLDAQGLEDAFVQAQLDEAMKALSDDFNTAGALAAVFQILPKINALSAGQLPKESLSKAAKMLLLSFFEQVLQGVLGLDLTPSEAPSEDLSTGLMDLVLELRKEARNRKDWALSDKIRDDLAALGIQVKDGKTGTSWERLK